MISKNSISLPPAIFHPLKEFLTEHHFKCGKNIFIQGDHPKAIFIVRSGRVKITRVTEEGNENVLCVRGSGDIFCPLPLLDGGNELGTAIAMTDVVLWRIDKEQFLFLASNNPNLLAYVQRDCLFEVRNLVRRMEKVAFKNVYQRLASAIVDLLERQVTKGGSPSELKIKHHDLAGIIGASRESVSRSLSRLEKQHLLTTYRGRLVVHNIEKIKESIK